MQAFDSTAKEYMRRIGYTSGTFELLRFGKIVHLFEGESTRSRVWLVNEIRRWKKGDQSFTREYAKGMLEVAEALGLLRHTGEVYALAWRGSVYLALLSDETWPQPQRAFFLRRLVEADADESLNILQMVALGSAKATDLVDGFLESILRVIDERRRDVGRLKEPRRFQYKTVLDEAHRAVARSLGLSGSAPGSMTVGEPTGRRRLNTARHHVVPRITWLKDVGLLEGENDSLNVTVAGRRLLEWLSQRGWVRGESLVVVPPPDFLMLDASEGMSAHDRADLTCATFNPDARQEALEPELLLREIVSLYDRARSPTFNQASVDAIGEALELRWLAKGRKIYGWESMESVLGEYPDYFSKLLGGGRVAFITLRKSLASG